MTDRHGVAARDRTRSRGDWLPNRTVAVLAAAGAGIALCLGVPTAAAPPDPAPGGSGGFGNTDPSGAMTIQPSPPLLPQGEGTRGGFTGVLTAPGAGTTATRPGQAPQLGTHGNGADGYGAGGNGSGGSGAGATVRPMAFRGASPSRDAGPLARPVPTEAVQYSQAVPMPGVPAAAPGPGGLGGPDRPGGSQSLLGQPVPPPAVPPSARPALPTSPAAPARGSAAATAGGSAAGTPAQTQAAPPPARPAAPAIEARTAQGRRMMSLAERRISQLHGQLRIGPPQEEAWQRYAAALRADAERMDGAYAETAQARQSGTAVQALQAYARLTQIHAEDMQALAGAFEQLYGVLGPEQRAQADRAFREGGGSAGRSASAPTPHGAAKPGTATAAAAGKG